MELYCGIGYIDKVLLVYLENKLIEIWLVLLVGHGISKLSWKITIMAIVLIW